MVEQGSGVGDQGSGYPAVKVTQRVDWQQGSQEISLYALKRMVDSLIERGVPSDAVLSVSAGSDQRDHDSWIRITGTWEVA